MASNETREPDQERGQTENTEQAYQQARSREMARGQTRRRQTTAFFIIVGVVIAIGVLAAAINQQVVNLPFASRTPCPPMPPAAAAPADTAVRVLNATDRDGLAAAAAEQLTARGYQVVDVGNAEGNRDFPDPAQVRHGATGVATARAVQAQVLGAVLVQDERAGADVDLVLGNAYTELATEAQAQEALAPPPEPTDCEPVEED